MFCIIGLHLILLKQVLSLNLELDWQLPLPAGPSYPETATSSQIFFFNMGVGDWNSGFQACTVNSLSQ